MEIISINTKKPYKIYIGNAIDYSIIKQYIAHNVVLFFDGNFSSQAIEKIENIFENLSISYKSIKFTKTGENIKTVTHYEEICKKLIEMENINRKTVFVAIGGGTVGDFVGFVASTFMRGVDFIQMPTTLLSMVDSSVGGKVAINIASYKNYIGSFWQPKAVLIDTSFLQTLPEIEMISGYAEVIKYGFIKSKAFFDYLLTNEELFAYFLKNRTFDKTISNYITNIVARSCKIKAEIVEKDEDETNGLREILNFGHTFAHAFEGSLLGKIPHGIAVGIGMIYACKVSGIDTSLIEKHYKNIGLYFSFQDFCIKNNFTMPQAEELLLFMKKDKKNDSNTIKLILLNKIEEVKIEKFSSEKILEILQNITRV